MGGEMSIFAIAFLVFAAVVLFKAVENKKINPISEWPIQS